MKCYKICKGEWAAVKAMFMEDVCSLPPSTAQEYLTMEGMRCLRRMQDKILHIKKNLEKYPENIRYTRKHTMPPYKFAYIKLLIFCLDGVRCGEK